MGKIKFNLFVIALLFSCNFIEAQDFQKNIELLSVNTSAKKLINSDTTVLFKNAIPFSGIDTMILLNELPDKKLLDQPLLETQIDTFIFIVSYENGLKKTVNEYYKSGELRREMLFENGLKEGKEISYFKNSKTDFLMWWKDGKPNGPSLSYYESGTLKSYLNYTKFSKEKIFPFFDISTKWFEDGRIYSETKPICCGEENATEEIWYYRNGNTSLKAIFNNGKQLFSQYFKDGKLAEEGFIINSPWSQVGTWRRYYPNGKFAIEMNYKDSLNEIEANVKHGRWSYWSDEGVLLKEEYYENNELIEVKEYVSKRNH